MICLSCGEESIETHKMRIQTADLKAPIIVMNSEKGEIITLDGLHRLEKAVQENLIKLPGKFITQDELDSL